MSTPISAPRQSLLATVLLSAIFLSASLATSMAQAAIAPKSAAMAGRAECVASVGLCVNVPASWQRLGNVFQDFGFVTAEPHPGVDSAAWPQLTVAALAPPAQKSSGTPPSLDSLIDLMLAPGDPSTSVETLQRTRLLLNGADAEIVRVQIHTQAGDAGDIEDIALIQGDDGLVYSIALRCAPQDFARLEPVFQQTAGSWRIKPTATVPAPPSPPKPGSGKP